MVFPAFAAAIRAGSPLMAYPITLELYMATSFGKRVFEMEIRCMAGEPAQIGLANRRQKQYADRLAALIKESKKMVDRSHPSGKSTDRRSEAPAMQSA